MSTKYLINGSAVTIVEEFKSGFLVRGLFIDDNEIEHEGRQFFVDRVFDKAPTEKIDNEIAARENRLKKLSDELEEKRKGLLVFKEQETEIAKKITRREQLKTLFDFIDGKIAYYVEDAGYGDLKLIDFKDATCNGENEHTPKDKRPLKLLTLFGSSKGQLDWRLNCYKDGSGTNTKVYPAISKEAAVIEIEKALIEKMAGLRPDPYVISTADKFGITIPNEYRARIADEKTKSLSLTVQRLEDELKKAREALANYSNSSLAPVEG